MKTVALLPALAFLAFSAIAEAQSDTAHHRAVYKQINENEASLKKVSGKYKDEPLEFTLTGWMEDGKLVKIVAKSNEDGAGVEEFYLEDEAPLFVFSSYFKNHLSKTPERVENRLYFKDGDIFKWLTTEKDAGVLHGEDYVSEGERLTSNCAAFVTVLKKKGSAAASNAQAMQVLEGVFVGIEEGDYFHWNMRNSAGEDVSFFMLQPDASVEKVIASPEKFIGRKCQVTWKKSTENIPEAGGKMEIEQIISVQWLGKK
ncbi:hypothetical protein EI77_01740 [Prosthecobacter fusiformis]|uniref:Uncharacterized protein n=1 Tax=Prosthecobacter fusiformis TaxID=48464 RepID=A0A4R7S4J4_9BACT|nr:hypothetical protein [Prosthecobacter fusiformis]TDU73271.1 hypothetical protein EI77_01740 [Prosthecobacter fusiformis]